MAGAVRKKNMVIEKATVFVAQQLREHHMPVNMYGPDDWIAVYRRDRDSAGIERVIFRTFYNGWHKENHPTPPRWTVEATATIARETGLPVQLTLQSTTGDNV
jgi:hypothetical protein